LADLLKFSLLIPTTVVSAYCVMQMVEAYTVFSRL